MKKHTILSVAEMREADAYTIAKGIPSKKLMGRAAQGVYDSYADWARKSVMILCGSGNNGGDGYALGEILADHGIEVCILRVSEKLSEDGATYYERCKTKGVSMHLWPAPDLPAGKGCADLSTILGKYPGFRPDIIVDCMLGTGFSGQPREPIASAIREINRMRREQGAMVISVDINSGMNGDTGEAALAVESDLTVSIGYYKSGFFSGRSGELVGSLKNVDIGIELPVEIEQAQNSKTRPAVLELDAPERADLLDKLHTTKGGESRIRKNLSLQDGSVVSRCKTAIAADSTVFVLKGKNLYAYAAALGCFTIHASSGTIITAHLDLPKRFML